MDYQKTLTRLCALQGPSGFEEPVARVAEELLRPLVDECSVTRLGSVLGVRRCGRPGAPKLLLDAHLDEIGFLITGHEDGFLRFTALGGVDPRMLPDREMTVLTQPPVQGVVACLPPHIQTRDEMDRALPVSKLYLDVGLSQEEAVRRVPVGTPAAYREGCFELGERFMCGKAMDDRSCFAVLLDVAEQLSGRELGLDLYILGSTQEEVSGAGAITAVFGAVPDYCVAVDVTHGTTPDASKEKTFPLGGGPTIGVGPNCTRWMSDLMEEIGKQSKIPYQVEVMAGSSGTNAWPMQISREGVATAVLSLPLRYMHSPIEVCHREDMERTARLLSAFILRLGEEAQEQC